MASGIWETIHIDWVWFLELACLTASWVLLRTGDGSSAKPARLLVESVLLFAAFAVGSFGAMLIRAMLGMVLPVFPFHVLLAAIQGAISLVYLRLCASYQAKTSWLLWAGLFASALSLTAIGGQCSFLAGYFLGGGIQEGIARVLLYFAVPALAIYVRRFKFAEYDVIPNSGFRMLLYGIGCILLLYIVEDAFFGFELSKCLTLLVGYVCMLTMTLGAIRAMYVMCREQAAILELQTEKQRFLAERELSQATEATLENLRSIRHDLKNQYAYMRILLSEGRYEDLKSYFENLAEHLPPQLSIIDCGNRAVNTILNMEAGKLRTEKIPFEHQLVVPPVLPFREEHLCGIIVNLLDNACEECKRLMASGQENVKVRIEIVPHQSYLLIKCSNTTDRTVLERTRGGIRTSKGDERTHGYGTRIVTKLAAKYNGAADYTLENGMFVAKVLLDITEGRKHENQDRIV